jgi:hypothetical protein
MLSAADIFCDGVADEIERSVVRRRVHVGGLTLAERAFGIQ